MPPQKNQFSAYLPADHRGAECARQLRDHSRTVDPYYVYHLQSDWASWWACSMSFPGCRLVLHCGVAILLLVYAGRLHCLDFAVRVQPYLHWNHPITPLIVAYQTYWGMRVGRTGDACYFLRSLAFCRLVCSACDCPASVSARSWMNFEFL